MEWKITLSVEGLQLFDLEIELASWQCVRPWVQGLGIAVSVLMQCQNKTYSSISHISGLKVLKLFSCSTLLKFSLLKTIKMPTSL